MLESQSYISAEEELQSFVAKMNFDGDTSDIDTESKMLSWIDANLSSTRFTSLSEAESHWEEVKALGHISFQENIELYEGMDGRTRELKDLIIRHDPIVPQPVTNSTCNDTLLECTSNATISFLTSINEAWDSYENGNTSAGAASDSIRIARQVFSLSVGICADLYVDCVVGG